MSNMSATDEFTATGFSVCGYEKIEYDFKFLDGVSNIANPQLAQLSLLRSKTTIGKKAKSMETLVSIIDSMTEFGIYRKEPVLVVSGALPMLPIAATPTTSRIPTTVISLFDASESIKIAVSYGRYKNRLGA
ncbi:hypothetical protein QQZ08_005072 [Neonectria magnoliae]|uniref:Uncharacterized protein n=1 Tax=Neonectria magnoliae TaxID=2732573 RepID=A0ABR1I4I7_9HYPO